MYRKFIFLLFSCGILNSETDFKDLHIEDYENVISQFTNAKDFYRE